MQLLAVAIALLWVGVSKVVYADDDSDDFMDFSFDDLDGGSNGEVVPCDPMKIHCVNESILAEVRHPDRLVEQLITQVWSDFGKKLREDARLYDTPIDPLDVDSLLKRPIALKQSGSVYQADVKMHNISVLGLSNLTMDSVTATRNDNLTGLSVRAIIKCPLIAVRG
jgi:hypothetical protein